MRSTEDNLRMTEDLNDDLRMGASDNIPDGPSPDNTIDIAYHSTALENRGMDSQKLTSELMKTAESFGEYG